MQQVLVLKQLGVQEQVRAWKKVRLGVRGRSVLTNYVSKFHSMTKSIVLTEHGIDRGRALFADHLASTVLQHGESPLVYRKP